MAKENVYLYLAKRNKRGLRMLIVLPKSKKIYPTRVADLSLMALPTQLHEKLELTIFANRLLWEPWIESAEDYEALMEVLRKRGFRNLPNSVSPLFEQHTWERKPVMKPFAKKLMLRKKKP